MGLDDSCYPTGFVHAGPCSVLDFDNVALGKVSWALFFVGGDGRGGEEILAL